MMFFSLLLIQLACSPPILKVSTEPTQKYKLINPSQQEFGEAYLYQSNLTWSAIVSTDNGYKVQDIYSPKSYWRTFQLPQGYAVAAAENGRWWQRKGLEIKRTDYDRGQRLIDENPTLKIPIHGGLGQWAALSKELENQPTTQLALNVSTGQPIELTIEKRDQQQLRSTSSTQAIAAQTYFVSTPNNGRLLWVANQRLLAITNQLNGTTVVAEDVLLPKPTPPNLPQHLSEHEITFQSENVELAGTLTLPKSKTTNIPAVLLIQGSGPTDRDGSNKSLDFGILREIAWHLAKHGFASLRYDKRGVGKSKLKEDAEAKKVVFSDFVTDSQSMLSTLQKQNRIDRNCLFVIGHSEGAFIAPQLAQHEKNIKGIVMVAGSTRPFADVLGAQLKAILQLSGVPEHIISQQYRAQQAKLKTALKPAKNTLPEWVKTGTKNHYITSLLRIDTSSVVSQLQTPLLAVFGEHDIQVLPKAEQPAVDAVFSKLNDASSITLPGLDHLMMPTHGRLGMGNYSDPNRKISPAFLRTVSSWLEQRKCHKPM